MAKADRLARLDSHRIELEAEYAAVLIAALHETAAGKWGLFGHNAHLDARAPVPPVVTDLCDRGEEIDAMRARLGLEPFELHREFEASRGRKPSEAPGEPKQARAWLERIGKTA